MGAEGLIHVQLKLYLLFIAFAKIPELEGSISLSSLYGSDVNQGNLERRSVQVLMLHMIIFKKILVKLLCSQIVYLKVFG